MMIVRIDKPVTGGEIRAIPSKSAAHRLLICAALADGDTFVDCPGPSDDIIATVNCLAGLGAGIHQNDSGFFVSPIVTRKGTHELDAGESGSTLRFILPVGAALGGAFNIKMHGRLPQRTSEPLIKALCGHGCEIAGTGGAALSCTGRLTSGRYTLPGGVSSQFISGLLMALPMLPGGSEIIVTGKMESAPYIVMTIDALKTFGVYIGREDNTYRIHGGQCYRSPGTVRVEGDWSNAAFWFTAGALGGSVTLTGLDLKSKQGDREILEILKRFGANTAFKDNAITVSRGYLRGTDIDAGDIPDLVPVLALAAAAAEGETVIYNAGRLRLKESDRLKTVAETLTALGADISETRDGLIIRGNTRLKGGTVSSHGDHRIAMTAAAASAVCAEPVTITDAAAVRKSYPGFFGDFCSLGGEISMEVS